MSERLMPAEDMALTVARAQVKRGENPPINITTLLVMALGRLAGREDWTEDAATDARHEAIDEAEAFRDQAHGWD